MPIKVEALPRSGKLLFVVYSTIGPQQPLCVATSLVNLFDASGFMLSGEYKLTLTPVASHGWIHLSQLKDPLSQLPGELREQILKLSKVNRAYPDSNFVSTHTDAARKEIASFLSDEVVLRFALPTKSLLLYRDLGSKTAPPVPVAALLSDDPSVLSHIITIRDPELNNRNPVEAKFTRLNSSRSVYEDADLRPNSDEKQELTKILARPPTHKLTQAEKDMVWKFRMYLSSFKKGLVKFLKSVDWTHTQQAKIAKNLLAKWEAPDVDDALEMLSKDFAHYQFIRSYVVRQCLQKTPDEELQHYLLQLVQALRYDAIDSSGGEESAVRKSSLLHLLIERSIKNFTIASNVYWYLRVEEDQDSIFERYLREFTGQIHQVDKTLISHLETQRWLVMKLHRISSAAKAAGGNKQTQIATAAKLIQENLRTFDNGPIHLPINPSVAASALPELSYFSFAVELRLTQFRPASVHIFGSANAPMKFDFVVTEPLKGLRVEGLGVSPGKNYALIYKSGDDLRQDQLVMQLILLFDKLLKTENVDLKFVPYHVLSTSRTDGVLEFVRDAQNLANIDDIQKFLRKHNPDPAAPYGITATALDNYVKSCAGYCVATYVLGIGDRHLDNILLCKTGQCFHIDFGWLLGRDPKLAGLVSPVRLTKGMIEAMGGQTSDNYKKFVQYCREGFNIIRKSATLILNLLTLMTDAGIAQIQSEKDLREVENRLHLSLTDEEAAQTFESFLKQSVAAIGPKVTEFFHTLAKIKIYD